jgi:hypothetical protein
MEVQMVLKVEKAGVRTGTGIKDKHCWTVIPNSGGSGML